MRGFRQRFGGVIDHGRLEAAFCLQTYFGEGSCGPCTQWRQDISEIARERGATGFQADVLISNNAMLKIFEKTPYEMHSSIEEGVVSLKFRFDELKGPPEPPAGTGEET